MKITLRCTQVRMDGASIVADLYGMFTQDKGKSDPLLVGSPSATRLSIVMKMDKCSELVAGRAYTVTIEPTDFKVEG